VAVALSAASAAEHRPALLRNYLVVFGLAALVYAPWMPFLFQQTGEVYDHFWKELPPPARLLDHLSKIYLYGTRYPWHDAAALLLFALGLWELRQQRPLRRMLVWLAVSGPLIIYLISLKRPIFLPRLMVWGPLPFYVICGFGMRALRMRWLFVAGCLVLAVGSFFPLQRYYRAQPKPPWQRVLFTLQQRMGDGGDGRDQVILASSGRTHRQLDYYRSRRTDPVEIPGIHRPRRRTRLPGAVRQAEVVWFVAMHKPRRKRRLYKAELLQRLEARFVRTERLTFRKRVEIHRFER
jgi:hypothetical protein